MTALVIVPFNGGPASQGALRRACREARRDSTLVAALYVARIPRQLPLSADAPWLAHEVTRVQLLAEPIIAETGASAWAEWVCAREVAPAIGHVAAELEASAILLGQRHHPKQPAWIAYWSLRERLARLAPCPVIVETLPVGEGTGVRLSSGVFS